MSQADPASSPKDAGIAHNIVMKDEQIYCKTPEGERALVQRTRLVQRNLRNVLILVDGVATVADLTRKLGDGNFLRASLSELLRGGFVESIEESHVRRGLVAADAPEDEPQTIPIPDPDDKPVSLPPQLEAVFPPHSRIREELQEVVEEASPPDEPMTAPEPPAYYEPARTPTPPEPFWRRWFGARRQTGAPEVSTPPSPEPDQPPKTESAPEPIKVRIKPIRRGVASRPRWNWTSRSIAALLVAAALTMLAVVVFPYDRYRPEIETRISAWLGQPVTIGEVRFALSPRPGIALERVRLGGEQGVVLGSVRVVPSPVALLGGKWDVGTAVLERPLVDQRALTALLDSPKRPADSSIGLHQVSIERATVSVAGMALEDVSGTIELTPEGHIDEIGLRTADGSLRLTALPQAGSSLKVTLSGEGWRIPWRGGIAIESIEAEGQLKRNELRIDRFGLRMLGGTVSGAASVDWQQLVALSLQASYARIDLRRLLALIEPAARPQGDVSGKIALRANAPTFESTARAVSGGGPFTLERASLDGFDLVEAVRTRSDNPVRGGATRLEEFSGSISIDGGNWRLSGLRGNSGAMSTAGYLHQSGGKLDGVMDVQLRGSASQVNLPVVISGSLADPLLTAKRRNLAPASSAGGQGADEALGR